LVFWVRFALPSPAALPPIAAAIAAQLAQAEEDARAEAGHDAPAVAADVEGESAVDERSPDTHV